MSSSAEHEDVKTLLDRALAGEPPLTLDRDEVFREGRRRLRNRRLYSAGGAIAGVVAAAVGAVVLTGLAGDGPADRLPPAASRTGHPVSPRPSPPVTTTGTAATSPSTSDRHAAALTKVLLDSGLAGEHSRLTGADGAPARFRAHEGTYELRADVVTPYAEGSLHVSVGAAGPGDEEATCLKMPQPRTDCEVRAVPGGEVAIGTWKDHDTGEKRYIVFTARPDGTSVTAVATNLSERLREHGKPPSDRTPVVDDKSLVRLALLPDLRFASR